MYEFGEKPALTLVTILQVSLDDCCPVIIDILHRFIWKVNEWDIVQKPLRVIKARNIRRMVQDGCRREVGVRQREWPNGILGKNNERRK